MLRTRTSTRSAAAVAVGATCLLALGAGTSSAATTADPVVGGAILERYTSLGGPQGFLGNPLTDELGTPDGRGRFNKFEGGAIYWTLGTGAWEVHGAIRDAWGNLGYERSLLGYPVTNEVRIDGGAFSRFQGGYLYWTPPEGAHEVHGAIFQKWGQLGWEKGRLGFPSTNELPTPYEPGAFNHFQGGSVYWSPDTGANEIEGLIYDKWSTIGYEAGSLGFPTTDEYGVPGGRANDFEYGQITWTPDTGAVVTSAVDEVTAVDKVADRFTIGAVKQAYTYDANDTFASVDATTGRATDLTFAGFEQQLAAGAYVALEYSPDPTGESTFVLITNIPMGDLRAPLPDAVKASATTAAKQLATRR